VLFNPSDYYGDQIKEGEMDGALARMRKVNEYKILVGKTEGKRDHSEELDVDGKIILDWRLGKYGGKL
jgi:hypothetical protein